MFSFSARSFESELRVGGGDEKNLLLMRWDVNVEVPCSGYCPAGWVSDATWSCNTGRCVIILQLSHPFFSHCQPSCPLLQQIICSTKLCVCKRQLHLNQRNSALLHSHKPNCSVWVPAVWLLDVVWRAPVPLCLCVSADVPNYGCTWSSWRSWCL